MGRYVVILFFSTNYAIWASNELKRSAIPHTMIPVPRHLSSDCGACLRIERDDAARVRALLEAHSIQYDRCENLQVSQKTGEIVTDPEW